jgi:hypothetical protein
MVLSLSRQREGGFAGGGVNFLRYSIVFLKPSSNSQSLSRVKVPPQPFKKLRDDIDIMGLM